MLNENVCNFKLLTANTRFPASNESCWIFTRGVDQVDLCSSFSTKVHYVIYKMLYWQGKINRHCPKVSPFMLFQENKSDNGCVFLTKKLSPKFIGGWAAFTVDTTASLPVIVSLRPYVSNWETIWAAQHILIWKCPIIALIVCMCHWDSEELILHVSGRSTVSVSLYWRFSSTCGTIPLFSFVPACT